MLAAEGAVLLLEKLSPALERIDSSSGAIGAEVAALRSLVEGHGYEITALDVLNAYSHTMQAAENAGCAEQTRKRIRDLVAHETFGERLVTKMHGRHLGLS